MWRGGGRRRGAYRVCTECVGSASLAYELARRNRGRRRTEDEQRLWGPLLAGSIGRRRSAGLTSQNGGPTIMAFIVVVAVTAAVAAAEIRVVCGSKSMCKDCSGRSHRVRPFWLSAAETVAAALGQICPPTSLLVATRCSNHAIH